VPRSRIVALVLAGLVALAGAGCQGDEVEPVRLSFWSWVPNIDKVVAAWNAAHPDVQVSVLDRDRDAALADVLRSAGPPDLVQAEYQALPALVRDGLLADIAPEVAGVRPDFADSVWRMVSPDGRAVHALPQDIGPMMLYYRADGFERLKLRVPSTWAAFADAAREVRRRSPGQYLTTFSAAEAGWFMGLAQQAGAAWWQPEGDGWRVAVNDAGTRRVAPLPQWTAGARRTGNWGGSSTAVSARSPHRAEATEYALWLNTSPAATRTLFREGGIYPAALSAQAEAATAGPPAFFANQPDFYTVAQQVAATAEPFTYGPIVDATFAAFGPLFRRAVERGSSWNGLRAAGYTVVD
jgi:multiple sugar transport system substrate-binding protein